MLPLCSWCHHSGFCCRSHRWWHCWGFRPAEVGAGLCHLTDHLWMWCAQNISGIRTKGGTCTERAHHSCRSPASRKLVAAACSLWPFSFWRRVCMGNSMGLAPLRAWNTVASSVLIQGCNFCSLGWLPLQAAKCPEGLCAHSCLKQQSCRPSKEISSYHPLFHCLKKKMKVVCLHRLK